MTLIGGSTAAWNACTKSQPTSPDGNYEVETITDNPSITADKLVLANRHGDGFTIDDNDVETWKWNLLLAGNHDYFRLANQRLEYDTGITGNNNSYRKMELDNSGQGNIDFQANNTITHLKTAGYYCTQHYFCMSIKIDDNNFVNLIHGLYNGIPRIIAFVYKNGVQVSLGVGTYSPTARLRIYISGINIHCQYADYNGTNWVTITSYNNFPTGNRIPSAWVYMYNGWNYGEQRITGYMDTLSLPVFTPTAASYRASGNVTSGKQELSAPDKYCASVNFNLSGGTSALCIDKVEIYDDEKTLLTTADTDITENKTLLASDFDNGLLCTTGKDFYFKVYFKGDGTGSCALNWFDWAEALSIEPVRFDGGVFVG